METIGQEFGWGLVAQGARCAAWRGGADANGSLTIVGGASINGAICLGGESPECIFFFQGVLANFSGFCVIGPRKFDH